MIKEYKYKNTYSIAVAAFVVIFYLCAVCFTKMNLQRISFYTAFLILFGIDIYRNANITIELYEDKVIQRQGKKKSCNTVFHRSDEAAKLWMVPCTALLEIRRHAKCK